MADQKSSYRWYIVNVYSGFEDTVAREIIESARRRDMEKTFESVFVPKEEVQEVKANTRTIVRQSVFPGYVFVKMIMTDEAWQLVRALTRVSGFLGGRNPIPMTDAEMQAMVGKLERCNSVHASRTVFAVGEQVRICDGPFTSMKGLIEEIDSEKARLKVCVSIFGRSTPVDLTFDQVESV